jgi:two-component system CheB/CheR fusion protein
MNRILMQLRSSTGHDFSNYKQSTIGRRIERRMLQHNIISIENYASYLKENPLEVQKLFKLLLINVTSFFRDAEAFSVLENDILPQLCKDRADGDQFRVWVAGCATGEEAYSIAILLRELMLETNQEFKVQIYSTDLAEDAIAIARAGIYPPNIAQDVTPERLHRFFIKQQDGGYRIKKEIREMVVFAIQNIIKDPPFTKLDLVSCRNVMIYLETGLQNRLIPAFHYALKPDGILFLSPSEGIGNHSDLFTLLNRKWKIYRATHSIRASRSVLANVLSLVSEPSNKSPDKTMIPSKETNFAEITRRTLLQYYAPASVVTDLKGNMLYVHGDTGNYLRPAPGNASLNVIDMARSGLELELRSAMRTAANDIVPTLDRVIQLYSNDGAKTVSLSVRPILDPDNSQNLLLVSFNEVTGKDKKRWQKRITKPAELSQIEELELDLAYLRENYQSSNEEQQASNEELKSINEEMQSTNEELQSTNEELETSKEELQSVNEELITVNAELQGKIDQLADMQNDMKNLLDNTNIGTVFLDDKFIIRRFTREATNIFRLVSTDIGRSLNDIKSDIKSDELLNQAKTVLESLVPLEREVLTNNGIWFMVRIQPYRTLNNIIEGVVLTFTNISKRVAAEAAVQHERELAESIVDSIQAPLLVLDSRLQVVSANRAFYQYFHVMAADTIGCKVYSLGNGQWNIPALRELLEVILPQNQVVEGYVVEHDFPVIGLHKISLNARRILSKASEPAMILLTVEDISDNGLPVGKA